MRDPSPLLLSSKEPAVVWRTRRDLLDERVDARATMGHPAVVRALRSQAPDGRFRYPGTQSSRARATEDYDQLETFKTLLELVSKYGLTARHEAISRASEFLFRRQTAGGDFRGILGAQYTPYYSAAIVAVLVEAGIEDVRVDRGMRWLLSMRQDDGGWAIPARTREQGASLSRAMSLREPLEPDRARPSSHLVTGIVLRAFAAHPRWRTEASLASACALLASRFFKPDAYADRRASSYWRKLAFPFRWTDALSALDALSQLGVDAENTHVRRAMDWLAKQQRRDGTWRCGYPHAKDPSAHEWVTFAAWRFFRRAAKGPNRHGADIFRSG